QRVARTRAPMTGSAKQSIAALWIASSFRSSPTGTSPFDPSGTFDAPLLAARGCPAVSRFGRALRGWLRFAGARFGRQLDFRFGGRLRLSIAYRLRQHLKQLCLCLRPVAQNASP